MQNTAVKEGERWMIKSKRLRRPQKIKRVSLRRKASTLLMSSTQRAPEPLLDWKEILAAKVAFCHQCLEFNELMGGCGLQLMPNKNCSKLNVRHDSDGMILQGKKGKGKKRGALKRWFE